MADVSPATSTGRTTARSTDGPGRWLPATVLALSVAAVAVGCAGGGAPGQDGTATSPGVTPTPSSTPTATPTPDAPTTEPATPAPLSFERVPHWQDRFTLGRETVMRDVAASGGEVLVVGLRGSGGAAWKPVTRPWGVIANRSFEGEDVRLTAVVPPHVREESASRPYVAVGGDFDTGMTWATRTGSRGRLRPVEGAGLLRDAATAGRRVVAVGETRAGRPAAFHSVDGERWQAARVPDGGLEPPSPRGSVPLRMVAHGPAGFVATGWPTSAAGHPLGTTHLWVSGSGERWRHLDPATTGIDGGVVALAGHGDGFVAVTDDGTVHRSRDARSWKRVGRLPRPGQRPLAVSSIRALRSTDRLLVTGSVCESQRRLSCSPQVWASPDGDAWERKALPGDGQPEAVTRTADGQLVVVGRGPCPGGCPEGVLHAAAAWVTTPIVPAG